MQKSTNKIDHIVSILLSLIINSLLVLLLLSTLNFKPEINKNNTFAKILETIDSIIIDEPTDFQIIEEKTRELTNDIDKIYENIPTPTIDNLTTISQQENIKLNDIIPTASNITLPLFVNTVVKDAITDSVIKFGGPKGEVGQTSVNKALQWLKNNQSENGGVDSGWSKGERMSWSYRIGYFSIFGSWRDSIIYESGSTVAKGIRWLVENQNDKGIIGQSQHTSYGHAMATYAMAEAYSVTSNPLLETVRIYIEKHENIILFLD